MEDSQTSSTTQPPDVPGTEPEMPTGSHPLEVAARGGIGPLSAKGSEVWHGRAKPCVTCGQLVARDATECEHCGQDLSPEMIEKMQAHAGPWYVLEHVRPFPGVSLELIIRQVRRGLITETSIVRGPATDYQWRFALETPGLCRYFGRCWECHGEVSTSDTHCQECLSHLTFEKPRTVPPSTLSEHASPAVARVQARAEDAARLPEPTAAAPAGPQSQLQQARGKSLPGPVVDARPSPAPLTAAARPSDELRQLSAAVDRADVSGHEVIWDEPPRVAGIRATWVAVGLIAIVIVALMFVTQTRTQTPTAGTAAPGMIMPVQ